MLRSMTGFGRAQGTAEVEDVSVSCSVELRSVNHRGLDVKVSGPSELQYAESKIGAIVRKHLRRGRVSVSVSVSFAASSTPDAEFDIPRAEAYVEQLRALANRLDIAPEVTLDHVLALGNLRRSAGAVVAHDAVLNEILALVEQATRNLVAERDREGQALAEDFLRRLDAIGHHVETIAAEIPHAAAHYRARLQQRVKDASERLDIEMISEERLAQEIVMYADKADITEELTRAREHLSATTNLVEEHDPGVDGAIGKKLDFYFQELIRETNTMGSKSQSATIASAVVDVRSEIERMREQVLNVE